MDPETDAYGQAMSAYLAGEESFEIIERDDGYAGPGAEPGTYFAPYGEWPDRVRAAMDRVRGRVLDVGCGAGRHALYLQDRGHEVLGIDASPGAVEVARERGVERARVLPVQDVADLGETFDAVLMLGNNFGLVGTAETAPGVLAGLAAVTEPDAVLLAESVDPRRTDEEAHRQYHEFNRERGRLPGALRMRIRYETYATDWFDYLLASPGEMRSVVEPSPWTVADVVEGDPDEPGYVGVLAKDGPD